MENIIEGLDSFISRYVNGTSIKQVTFDNRNDSWVVSYNYEISDDTFYSTKSMIEFLESDQNHSD
jgi:hypothetical protein